MRAPDTILPLHAEGLGFSARGIDILRDVALLLEDGPPTLIIGPNGAGKSVLLRLLHGLLPPSTGRVRWSGASAQARQSMVFQRPVLLRRTVAANVAYPLSLGGIGRMEREKRVQAALDLVGLAHLAERPARKLSGGEQQRLALARAAALHPSVLFLDEPCASLDPAATRAVEQVIAHLAESGTKIIMTTHDLGQARRLAGDVVFLHRGRVREHSKAADFFASPATAEATAFLRGDLVW